MAEFMYEQRHNENRESRLTEIITMLLPYIREYFRLKKVAAIMKQKAARTLQKHARVYIVYELPLTRSMRTLAEYRARVARLLAREARLEADIDLLQNSLITAGLDLLKNPMKM